MQKQINQFILYLKVERGYALNTQQAYARDLQKLLAFTQTQSVERWASLSSENLNLFAMTMRHQNISGRTIRRHLSSIRGFLSYLVNQGLLEVNCAQGLQSPKVAKSLPKTLDYERLVQMLTPKSSAFSELRDAAMVEVLYSCGLRVSELVGLDIEDVDASQGFLRVMGKGSKVRYTPLGESAQKSINRYLQKTSHTNKALFINNRQDRISTRTVQNIIKNRALSVGIKVNVHPHMLRHAAATHFLQSSHDLRSVQEFLGHKSIKSTQVYAHLDFLELSKVYDKCHPRAKKSS